MSSTRSGVRHGVVSGDEIAVSVPVPDWDAKEERSVIAKMVRERSRIFSGEAEVKPLFLERKARGYVARYRVNFMKGSSVFMDYESRTMLGSAYVVVLWRDCSSSLEGENKGKACWEPVAEQVRWELSRAFGSKRLVF